MTIEDPIFLISAHTEQGLKSRTFGFYHTEEEARNAVERDDGGMHEVLYVYLVIERVWPGIHGENEAADWFQWVGATIGHNSRWEWCNAPEWTRGLTALGGVG